MVGLGTIFIAVLAGWRFLLWRGRLFRIPLMLWALMLSAPLPYIANTAGWMTAELGRQPWLIYGLMRTAAGTSPGSAGNALFTLMGFMGMYTRALDSVSVSGVSAKSSTGRSRWIRTPAEPKQCAGE